MRLVRAHAAEHPSLAAAIRSVAAKIGCSAETLRELIVELPADAALSLEVPMAIAGPAEARARRIFDATQKFFEQCRGTTGGSLR